MKREIARWRNSPAVVFTPPYANVSVVFTWHLDAAWEEAVRLKWEGWKVRVGGPALHVRTEARTALAEIAEVGGDIPDAVRWHNPDATFASRGCPVGCWFCIVPSMEGREFTLIEDFEPRPILCDNNLSALPVEYQNHIVARYKAACVPLMDANSGFEPRTFDEATFHRWAPINRGPWRFACDDAGDAPHVWRVLDMLRPLVANQRLKRVYVLIGNEPFEACMERIVKVIELGGEPHVQPLMKLNAATREPWVRFDWTRRRLKDVARWANRRLWKYVEFADYSTAIRTARRIPKDLRQGELEMIA